MYRCLIQYSIDNNNTYICKIQQQIIIIVILLVITIALKTFSEIVLQCLKNCTSIEVRQSEKPIISVNTHDQCTRSKQTVVIANDSCCLKRTYII